jgi:hypothetical protein
MLMMSTQKKIDNIKNTPSIKQRKSTFQIIFDGKTSNLLNDIQQKNNKKSY